MRSAPLAKFCRSGLGVLCAAATIGAWAQGGLILLDPPPAETTQIAFGPGVLAFPEAPGSDKTRLLPLIALDLYTPAGIFVSTDYGLGWNLSTQASLQYGLRLYPHMGRHEGDAERLRGMGDIGLRVEEAAFFNVRPTEYLLLQSSARHGAGVARDGWQMELGATSGLPLGTRALLGLTLGASWANAAYQQSYFGVSPAQSARSGHAAYALGGGLQDLNAALSLEYRLAPRWRCDAQYSVARLAQALAASPLVGRRNQATVSLALYYEFQK